MENIGEVDLTPKEKHFITSMINVHGTGQHPYCDETSYNYFKVAYVKEILNSKRVAVTISPRGLEILTEIKQ
jgi:hypothetical protein